MRKENKLACIVDIYMFIGVIASTLWTIKFLLNWLSAEHSAMWGTLVLIVYASLAIAGYQANEESYRIKYSKH